jgi:tetratricopeptide (TPR) repeat protein
MTSPHLKLTAPIILFAAAFCANPSLSRAANGIMLDVVVHEILDADPLETAVIDSVTYPVLFDRPTTLRAGNFVVDVTAGAGANGSIDLRASLYVSGPLPANRSDEASITPGASLIVDDIRGKGKSHYRVRFAPHSVVLADDAPAATADSLQWETISSLRARYLVPKGVLPPLQFLPVRTALDHEFEGLIDTLGLDRSTRLLVYLTPGEIAGWPVEPDYGYAIDPARYRVVAFHSPLSPRITPRALALAALYRSWGYAPQLLTSGIAGYFEFADYEVQNDRASGQSIPLDSLARTIDYKRRDRRVADHHAESFVAWLVNTYGLPHFKNLYERATDLSIHRAFWSVYGRTLAELEKQWLGYLKARKFHREELMHFATREIAFRNFEAHLALLEQAAAAVSPPTEEILRDMGIAQGQLGRWSDAVASFTRLVNEYPEEKSGRWFLAEAQRAAGDDIAAWRTYAQLLQKTPSDPQAHLRMGEILWEGRRADSAATLWRRGLSNNPGPLTSGELRLRLGHYFERRRGGLDSSRSYFNDARRSVSQRLIDNPTDASAWIITGEALLGLDSVEAALEHLALVRAVSDAPVDLGRVRLLRGFCYDKLGRRKDAVAEYEAALSGKAEEPVARLARRYLNRSYGR